MTRVTVFFASSLGIVCVGSVIGIFAVALQYLGNPANRGICVACFTRDIAGAIGLHRAAVLARMGTADEEIDKAIMAVHAVATARKSQA